MSEYDFTFSYIQDIPNSDDFWVIDVMGETEPVRQIKMLICQALTARFNQEKIATLNPHLGVLKPWCFDVPERFTRGSYCSVLRGYRKGESIELARTDNTDNPVVQLTTRSVLRGKQLVRKMGRQNPPLPYGGNPLVEEVPPPNSAYYPNEADAPGPSSRSSGKRSHKRHGHGHKHTHKDKSSKHASQDSRTYWRQTTDWGNWILASDQKGVKRIPSEVKDTLTDILTEELNRGMQVGLYYYDNSKDWSGVFIQGQNPRYGCQSSGNLLQVTDKTALDDQNLILSFDLHNHQLIDGEDTICFDPKYLKRKETGEDVNSTAASFHYEW